MRKTAACLLALMALSGCQERPDTTKNRADYAEWCRDPATKLRVPDAQCDQGKAQWVYSLNGKAPSMGETASGTSVRPTTGTVGRAPEDSKFGTVD